MKGTEVRFMRAKQSIDTSLENQIWPCLKKSKGEEKGHENARIENRVVTRNRSQFGVLFFSGFLSFQLVSLEDPESIWLSGMLNQSDMKTNPRHVKTRWSTIQIPRIKKFLLFQSCSELYCRSLTLETISVRTTLQIVPGVPFTLERRSRSSIWLHMATNRSKNILPPISISICMVPLRLNVLRLRMIKAR